MSVRLLVVHESILTTDRSDVELERVWLFWTTWLRTVNMDGYCVDGAVRYRPETLEHKWNIAVLLEMAKCRAIWNSFTHIFGSYIGNETIWNENDRPDANAYFSSSILGRYEDRTPEQSGGVSYILKVFWESIISQMQAQRCCFQFFT